MVTEVERRDRDETGMQGTNAIVRCDVGRQIEAATLTQKKRPIEVCRIEHGVVNNKASRKRWAVGWYKVGSEDGKQSPL